MRTIRCDICNKIIDDEKDPYYEIDEVCYHAPNSEYTTIHTRDKAKQVSQGETVESWCSWENIDFCVECWWSEKNKNLRELVEKRIG